MERTSYLTKSIRLYNMPLDYDYFLVSEGENAPDSVLSITYSSSDDE